MRQFTIRYYATFTIREFKSLFYKINPTGTTRRYYVDTLKTKFLQISTSFPRTSSVYFWWLKNPHRSTYIFRRNFDGRKIHVVFNYFFRYNFAGGKYCCWFSLTFFDVISMIEISTFFQCIFFRCNFNSRNLHVVSTYFFWCNFSFHNILVVSFYFFLTKL